MLGLTPRKLGIGLKVVGVTPSTVGIGCSNPWGCLHSGLGCRSRNRGKKIQNQKKLTTPAPNFGLRNPNPHILGRHRRSCRGRDRIPTHFGPFLGRSSAPSSHREPSFTETPFNVLISAINSGHGNGFGAEGYYWLRVSWGLVGHPN